MVLTPRLNDDLDPRPASKRSSANDNRSKSKWMNENNPTFNMNISDSGQA